MSYDVEILTKIEALIELQKEQRLALTEGRFDQLQEIDGRTDAARQSLEQAMDGAPPAGAYKNKLVERIGELQEISNANQQLAQAAQRGVKSAQMRMSDIKAAKSEIGVYSASGAKVARRAEGDRFGEKY
ncbi:MAG: hypothetical protein AAGF51_15880 [Pseudomonadota bacterium]